MSKIMFRQKTDGEIEAEASERQKRKGPAPAAAAPSIVPSGAQPPTAAEEPSFALDGEPQAPKPKKGRKK